MHYCHPGPVDAWSDLVFNALTAADARHRRQHQHRQHLFRHTGAATGGGGGGGARRSRFFDIQRGAWQRDTALVEIELAMQKECDATPGCPRHSNRSLTEVAPWWPFACGSRMISSACSPHMCGAVRSVPPALAALNASMPRVEAAIAAAAAQCAGGELL